MVQQRRLRAGIGYLVATEALVFGVAALAHAGVPVGFAEPPLAPAMIVEGLIAAAFVFSAATVAAQRASAWSATVAAHVVAVAGVLLGLWAQRDGGGSANNRLYHRVMLSVALAALASLMVPAVKGALGRWTAQS